MCKLDLFSDFEATHLFCGAGPRSLSKKLSRKKHSSCKFSFKITWKGTFYLPIENLINLEAYYALKFSLNIIPVRQQEKNFEIVFSESTCGFQASFFIKKETMSIIINEENSRIK